MENKARVEDALHATRAAVEEGVVPGGGGARQADEMRGRLADNGIDSRVMKTGSE